MTVISWKKRLKRRPDCCKIYSACDLTRTIRTPHDSLPVLEFEQKLTFSAAFGDE